MSRSSIVQLIGILYLLVLFPSSMDCRPRTQKIVIHGHEWTVPNEPGWEEVLREAEPIRHQLLSNCASSRDCRMAAGKLRDVFLKHSVSAKYYDDSLGVDAPPTDIDSIFKWG